MFFTLLGVALIPTAAVVAAGAWALGDTLERAGSAGPWQSVAESGDALTQALATEWPDSVAPSAVVNEAMAAHQQALDESAGMSRLYAAVSQRVLDRLPLFVAVLGLGVAALAWLAARVFARSFAEPVSELVEWTGRIAREEPLPATATTKGSITELNALRAALHTLSGEVAEGRARAVEAARLSTWSAAARRVAHEIKNPLTPMKMAARQLRGAAEAEASERAADVLLEEIDRLDALARTFVQVGAAPDGPPARLDLRELVSEVVRPLREGSVALEVRAPETTIEIDGHLDALRGAVRNLVVNAIESSETGRSPDAPAPTVVIMVDPGSNRDGRSGVLLTVDDDGVGLPEGLEASIWNLDVTTKRRGSGIGLAVVRQTVLAHGGHVEAENRPNGGARFTVWLPQPSS